jgi:hypothetical protein
MKHLIGAAILTAALALAGCELQFAESGDPDPSLGVQDQSIHGPTETPLPEVCEITFVSPGQGDGLGTYGPVDFSWAFDQADWISNHWSFEKYVLVIVFPGGNPLVHYDTQDSHKTLYMENFHPAGTYTAQIRAIGSAPYHEAGSLLCWDEITFSKDAYQSQPQKVPAPMATPCLAGTCP